MISRAHRISTRQRNALLKSFSQDMMAYSKRGACAAKVAKVNRNTADFWYRHFREAIFHNTRLAPRFFGEVEMDQAEFGGRGRKKMESELKRLKKTLPYGEYQEKAKLIRREHKVMVFGMLQRGGQVYAHIIARADKRTLMPIVRLVVEPGSTVLTDKWRGFTDLGLDGYEHKSVNHSEEYQAKDGTHINGIESFWSFAKRRMQKFNGVARTTLPLHIKECEFRYNNKDVEKALKLLFKKGIS